MSSAQEKNATTLANWREVLQNPQEVDEELGSYLKSKGLNTGKKPVKLARLKAIFSTLTKHLDIEYPVGVKDKLIDSLTVAEIDNHLAHILQSLGASTSWFVDVKRAPEHLVTRYFQAAVLRGCHPVLKRLKANITTPNFDKIWTAGTASLMAEIAEKKNTKKPRKSASPTKPASAACAPTKAA